MNPRFLIDEHLLGALPDAIERYNRSVLTPIDALCVGDPGAPPRGLWRRNARRRTNG
jgi:hypothetical protein